MNYFKLIKRGIVHENPIFIQLMALCPLLAVTTSAINALYMGLATTVVMICACSVMSALRRVIPGAVRIMASVIITAGFVSLVQFIMDAYVPPAINDSLGIYIPLIVVNCVVFARIESFAMKNNVFASAIDALGMGLGVMSAMFVVGVIREFLGSGAVLGHELLHDPKSHVLIMVMAPGAFFTLGCIIMAIKLLQERQRRGGE